MVVFLNMKIIILDFFLIIHINVKFLYKKLRNSFPKDNVIQMELGGILIN